MNTKDNAFLGAGVDALFGGAEDPNEFEIIVDLDDIEIEAQVREEFEDEENELAELGRSLRKRQLQAILLRPNRTGRDKPYLLVAGERRVRGARLEGLSTLRARVQDMSDEEAEDAQLAENIQRKNLTQIEEARKIQRDLDRLGSVEAVLEKHQKSRAWLSKILGLLKLPEQAKRLVTENISADVEVISTVKTIEKADPKAAKALVDDLKKTRGKANARDRAAEVKDQVKPPKKAKASKGTPASGKVATAKDRSAEQPGAVAVFADAKNGIDVSGVERLRLEASAGLAAAYEALSQGGKGSAQIIKALPAKDRKRVTAWLIACHEAGQTAEDAGRAVMEGVRQGSFHAVGEGAFALVAFLQGRDQVQFSLEGVFECVKG